MQQNRHEKYRDDLRLMYLPEIDAITGELTNMTMPVLQTHKFSLRRASAADAKWLAGELDRESRRFDNTGVEWEDFGSQLHWG